MSLWKGWVTKVFAKNEIKVWKECVFKNTIKHSKKWDGELDVANRMIGPCKKLFARDVENAIYHMDTGKATLSGIAADLLKFMGQDCVKKLTNDENILLEGLIMPSSWSKSELVVRYKEKYNTKSSRNY